jgi:quercetin dioxygenase-like cupin family protein
MSSTPSNLSADTPYPGIRRRTVDCNQATVVQYTFEPGATFPLHRHPQEQITVVRDGALEITAGGQTHRLSQGDWSLVVGGEEHGITAGEKGASFLAILVPRRDRNETITLTQPEQ